MAALYRARLAERPAEAGQAIRDAQLAWLRRRAECEGQAEGSPALVACIKAAIAARTAELSPPAPTPKPATPPAPREASVARAGGTWQFASDGNGCAMALASPGGRRFAIERRRSGADIPVFHPAGRDAELVLPGDRVVFLVDQQRLPALVSEGTVTVSHGSEAGAMRLILAGRSLTVVRQLDTLLEVPLDGVAGAMAELARRCPG
ncbi:hypothetical protein EDC65_0479 [Stella humosa]|uniref:Uncharacterized protein n=2 Tax=Stella humosa TaxID=94 RepID=A0A3N1MC34_9PROT|nr:hypothetical protein EDC65_0479 [Stella humosa]BBK31675.1 hypothetical protein STHU_23090 [Stella humosa]